MPQSPKPPAHRRVRGQQAAVTKRHVKVTVTLYLDADFARRLQTIADAAHHSLAAHVEDVRLREVAAREEANRLITMYVAPGASDSIRPEDVIRTEGESDEDYATRQKLTAELWSIPDIAGGGLGFLADEPDLYSDKDLIERYR
jgi:hypothetical protein